MAAEYKSSLYTNERLHLQVQVVKECPGGFDINVDVCNNDALTLYNQYSSLPINFSAFTTLAVSGGVVLMPGTNYVVEQSFLPLAICLTKVLLFAIKAITPDMYENGAKEGMQFYKNKLKELQNIELHDDDLVKITYFTVFLENVEDSELDNFITQLQALPLVAFLKSEITKIHQNAGELFLYDTTRYLTIDIGFRIFSLMYEAERVLQPFSVGFAYSSEVVLYSLPKVAVSDVYTMSDVVQDDAKTEVENLKTYLQELVDKHFTFYVRFVTFIREAEEEKIIYNGLCTSDCHFFTIKDVNSPAEHVLVYFWEIMDHYNQEKAVDPTIKLMLHFSSGKCLWFLISYIMLNKVKTQGVNAVLRPLIQALHHIYELCDEEVSEMFEKPFFMENSGLCPNALKRFAAEYSNVLAREHTLELLSMVLKKTPVLKEVAAYIYSVNTKAYNDIFVNTNNRWLFIEWVFVIVKTILHNTTIQEPTIKRRKTEPNDNLVFFENPPSVREVDIMANWGGAICGNSGFGCKLNVLTYLQLVSRSEAERIFNFPAAYKRAFDFSVLIQYLNTRTNEEIVEKQVPTVLESQFEDVCYYLYNRLPNHTKTLASFNYNNPKKYAHAIIFTKEDNKLYLVDPLFSNIYDLLNSNNPKATRMNVADTYNHWHFDSISFALYKYPLHDRKTLEPGYLKCKSQFVDPVRYGQTCDESIYEMYTHFIKPEDNVDCEESTTLKRNELHQYQQQCTKSNTAVGVTETKTAPQEEQQHHGCLIM